MLSVLLSTLIATSSCALADGPAPAPKSPEPVLPEPKLPDISLTWKRGAAVLSVLVPQGEHVAPEAPVHGYIDQGDAHTEWAVAGSTLAAGLHLGVVEGPLSAQIQLSLCQDAGTTCRQTGVAVSTTLTRPTGSLVLDGQPVVAAPKAEAIPDPAQTFAADPDAALADAQAAARATGRRVLIDFSAVWCPPCNMLSAEVLHAPDQPDALTGMVLVTVDADRADSWTLKNRYQVGGYPTLVATDADGRELARLLGYPGLSETLDWLDAVRQGLDLSTPDAAPPSPQAALDNAYAFARQGQLEPARSALEIALGDPTLADRPELHRTRFLLDHGVDEFHWLLAHDLDAADPAMDWIFDAMELAQGKGDAPDSKPSDAIADDLRAGVALLLTRADPSQQADLLWVLGQLEPEGARRQALDGAAAAALSASLSGDMGRDRGYLGFQAELLADSGDVDGAVAVLQRAVRAWPDDFTFHYALARQLHEAGRDKQAMNSALAALDHGYGDNRLRAARSLAEILAALDLKDQAHAVIADALARSRQPPEGVEVRTTRYRKALTDLDAELSK